MFFSCWINGPSRKSSLLCLLAPFEITAQGELSVCTTENFSTLWFELPDTG
jgi:hypothetical protein